MADRQVALVTGVSSGIRRGHRARSRGHGYSVFGTVRSPDGVVPEGVERVVMDVRDAASIAAAVASILSRAGRIDALVNTRARPSWARSKRPTPPKRSRCST